MGARMTPKELDEFHARFRSGNDVPVTRVTLPWPGIGEVVVDALRGAKTK